MQLICTNFYLSHLKYNSKPGVHFFLVIYQLIISQTSFLLNSFTFAFFLTYYLEIFKYIDFFFLLLNHSKIILERWIISFRAMLALFGDVLPIYLRRLNPYFGHLSVWYHWLILSLLVSRSSLVFGPYSCLDRILFAI